MFESRNLFKSQNQLIDVSFPWVSTATFYELRTKTEDWIYLFIVQMIDGFELL